MQKEFVVLNFKRFRPYLVANAPLQRLYSGVMWAEGPVYFADLGVLLFSDVPGEKILRYVDGQEPTVFRAAFRQRERQHARSPGTPSDLRERQSPGHTHGIRRQDHGARRTLRGQAPQFAERHRRQLGRRRLVHGSRLRNPQRLHGEQGAERDRAAMRFSHRPEERRSRDCDRRAWQAQRPRLLAR